MGLGPDAGAVYRLILTEDVSHGPELAARLGLPVERVAAALGELADAGLVRPSVEGEPGTGGPDDGGDLDGAAPALGERLQLADPRAGLRHLLDRQEARLREQRERFDRSRTAVERLLTEYAVAQPGSGHRDAERLIGRETVVSRMERLASGVRFECLSFQPPSQATAATTAAREVNLEVLARGVRMRSVYPDQARRDAPSMEHAACLLGHGAEIRTVPVIPVRMIVFDRAAAVLPVDPDSRSPDAVLVTAPGVISALLALFEAVWCTAVPLGQVGPPREDGLSRQEEALLRLLAQGLTDDAAANRLGLSVRTVRRNTAALMARLGARSRFEAGVRARERGWL
ncbi:helix-turn-helix transcriptional regulator [Kitasatospora camelliae]|uniref:LuxR C-terminal-related transcriptional regulator n=1 Tax=Kitasatospora camelliae TaxID=3156397 RepID=A0AAU8JQC1_9ACTN